MREDLLEDFDPKLKEEFIRSVHNTAQLVGLKELERDLPPKKWTQRRVGIIEFRKKNGTYVIFLV